MSTVHTYTVLEMVELGEAPTGIHYSNILQKFCHFYTNFLGILKLINPYIKLTFIKVSCPIILSYSTGENHNLINKQKFKEYLCNIFKYDVGICDNINLIDILNYEDYIKHCEYNFCGITYKIKRYSKPNSKRIPHVKTSH